MTARLGAAGGGFLTRHGRHGNERLRRTIYNGLSGLAVLN